MKGMTVRYVLGGAVWYTVLFVGVLRAANGDDETRCYGELGCFSIGDDFYHGVQRPLAVFPDKREDIETTFLIYTRENPLTADSLSWSATAEEIRKSHFNSSRPTKLITHGWMDDFDITDWMIEMKDSYLAAGDYNVVLVSWKGGAVRPYTKSTANARLVGAELALFVNRLREAFGTDPATLHGIGHSLGAHVMGYAGERVKTLGRITGLDPAGPGFNKMPPSVRIDPTDADFVDVIHTDAASQGFGMMDPTGHVDFYPNGGMRMPGCDSGNKPLSSFRRGAIQTAFEALACDHRRAIQYMVDSIKQSPDDCSPLSFECPSYDLFLKGQCTDCGPDGSSCAVMGHLADLRKRFKSEGRSRRMYLLTNGEKPFCSHQYVISLRMKAGKSLNGAKSFDVVLVGDKGTSRIKLPPRERTSFQNASYTFVAASDTAVGDVTEIRLLTADGRTSDIAVTPLISVEIAPMVRNPDPVRGTSNGTLRFCTSSPPASNTNEQLLLHRC